MIKQFTQQYKTNSLFSQIIRNIVVKATSTPNPNFFKFVPVGKEVMKDGSTLDFVAEKYSTISPLASKMFQIEGVNRVFYAKDYISVSKLDNSNWDDLKPKLIELIKQQFTTNTPLFIDD